MKQLWHKLWGEPIWTQDFDGEVRKSRLRRFSNGKIRVKTFGNWIIANDDGTLPFSYVSKWWPRT